MTIASSIAETRTLVAAARRKSDIIGVVPTMGALHAGHGKLIERARAECGFVVVTVFVNPIQFDRKEDLERYPRTLETDAAYCETVGADLVFAPSAAEMYPDELLTSVDVAKVAEKLEGEFRPGHFRGVATVVAKLFNIVLADRAYFGEKDAQQLAVIRRMARDLNVPTEIVPVATVRESDGLAMSSRNRLLTPEHRAAAPVLYRALRSARDVLRRGGYPSDARDVAKAMLASIPGVRIDYIEVADAETMQPVESIEGPVRIAAAAFFGAVRLIDNVAVTTGA